MHWLHDLNLLHLWHLNDLLATSSVQQLSQDVESLRERLEQIQQINQDLSKILEGQIEFLKNENESHSNFFSQWIAVFGFITTLLPFLGSLVIGLLAWLGIKNLDDYKAKTEAKFSQEISALVQSEMDNVERSLQRERIIGETTVMYCIPSGAEPKECEFLKKRGFKSVDFYQNVSQISDPQAKGVLVLDLINWCKASTREQFADLEEDEREAIAQESIEAALNHLSKAVLVVYVRVRGRVKYLDSIDPDRYVSPVNNSITLIGMVADAAYVADSV
ncbi:MAG: hypothetical protein WA902_14910 [Thermosynechococcaceae cyanobacterium]